LDLLPTWAGAGVGSRGDIGPLHLGRPLRLRPLRLRPLRLRPLSRTHSRPRAAAAGRTLRLRPRSRSVGCHVRCTATTAASRSAATTAAAATAAAARADRGRVPAHGQ